jgi:hypothetical protein
MPGDIARSSAGPSLNADRYRFTVYFQPDLFQLLWEHHTLQRVIGAWRGKRKRSAHVRSSGIARCERREILKLSTVLRMEGGRAAEHPQ